MAPRTCVLLSTCERYRALAEVTVKRLRAEWAELPPVRWCGLAKHADGLELRDDPGNWMQVTRSACEDLLAEGFGAAYVILDDHSPLGPCHSEHLNRTLPEMMGELGAVSVSLSGWGQGRKRFGDAVRWREFDFDRCRAETLWKFPLHPALWRLEALREILDRLIAGLPEAEQTPWAFERKGGAPDADLPLELKTGSYRIDGREMAAGRYPSGLRVLRLATEVYRAGVRRWMGVGAGAAVEDRLAGVRHYYHGPFPLFWSGIMRKGRLNEDLLFFLRVTGRSGWAEELESGVGGQLTKG